jgi:hypothetical protein
VIDHELERLLYKLPNGLSADQRRREAHSRKCCANGFDEHVVTGHRKVMSCLFGRRRTRPQYLERAELDIPVFIHHKLGLDFTLNARRTECVRISGNPGASYLRRSRFNLRLQIRLDLWARLRPLPGACAELRHCVSAFDPRAAPIENYMRHLRFGIGRGTVSEKSGHVKDASIHAGKMNFSVSQVSR